MRSKTLLVCIFVIAITSSAFAANPPVQIGSIPSTVKLSHINRDYHYYRPDVADDEKLPLLIWFHGAGSKGEGVDNWWAMGCNKVRNYGLKMMVAQPRLLPNQGWELDDRRKFLDHLKATYAIDENRIYIGGYSLGAFSTWSMGSAYPEEFAAMTSISGGINPPEQTAPLVDMPIWSFHGDKDTVVGYNHTKRVIDYLLGLGAQNIIFTTLEGAGHGISSDVMTQELFEWLLEHSLETEVPNVAPTVSIVSPSFPRTVEEGSTLALKVSASDSDGTIKFIRIKLDGVIVEQQDAASYTIDNFFKDLAPGDYDLRVSAPDDDNLWTVVDTTFTVVEKPNVAPAVSIVSPSFPRTVEEGSALPLSVSASDSDGTIKFIRVKLDGVIVEQQNAASYTIDNFFKDLAPGDYTLRVSAPDDDNLWTVVDTAFTVLPGSKMETGKLSLTHEWSYVTFDNPIGNPVVVLSSPSGNGPQAATVRVRNVTEVGFEACISEWDYLDGWHMEETVSYIAMSEGRQVIDGLTYEAQILDAVDNKKQKFVFVDTFGVAPVVQATVGSDNESSAVNTRLTSVDENGFAIMLQEEEANDRVHIPETVYVIAVEPGVSYDGKIKADVTGEQYNEFYAPLDFGVSFVNPSFFGEIQTGNGMDPVSIRWDASSLTGEMVEVQLQEEQSKNEEVHHLDESIGWIVIGE